MYTLQDCIKHKCRDSYILYIPNAVHAFGLVLLTQILLVQTHTHDVSAPLNFNHSSSCSIACTALKLFNREINHPTWKLNFLCK